MRPFILLAASLFLSSTSCADDSNLTDPLSSHQILPASFKPPETFKNVNLVRNINLEKGYVRETVNVVIENTDSRPQDQYYFPFSADTIGKVGGFEARDKKDASKPPYSTEVVEYDANRSDSAPTPDLPPIHN